VIHRRFPSREFIPGLRSQVPYMLRSQGRHVLKSGDESPHSKFTHFFLDMFRPLSFN